MATSTLMMSGVLSDYENILGMIASSPQKQGIHRLIAINDGDTMNGPGGIPWKAQEMEEAATTPPRRVFRWFPVDNHPLPADFQ